MWVKMGYIGSATILTGKINEVSDWDWIFAFQDNSTLLALNTNDSVAFSISPPINLNTWYLISFTSTSNVLSTYINGVKQDISQRNDIIKTLKYQVIGQEEYHEIAKYDETIAEINKKISELKSKKHNVKSLTDNTLGN
jgi:hypothetical protein